MSSLRLLAKRSGFSLATVSRALRADPAVRRKTRNAILVAAREIGYSRNPYLGQMMSFCRKKQKDAFRGNLALVWFDEDPRGIRHPDWLQIQRAACTRAHELGYELAEFVRKDFTPQRLLRILRSRNIRGVIVSPPNNASGKTRLRLDVENLSCVLLGWAILYPSLNRIGFDQASTLALAMHHARHHFGGEIAAVWDFKADRRGGHAWRARFLADHPEGPAVADRLIFDLRNLEREPCLRLIRRYRVRCLIWEFPSPVPSWLQSLIPNGQIIYLSNPRQVPCFGYIDRGCHLLGTWGVDMAVKMLQTQQFGIPEVPMNIFVPPRWVYFRRAVDEL